MLDIDVMLQWLRKDPDNRMVVVPGIHLRREFIELYDLDADQIIDMYSLSHYSYPQYEGKTLTFYNPLQCLKDVLPTKYEVEDLEIHCD